MFQTTNQLPFIASGFPLFHTPTARSQDTGCLHHQAGGSRFPATSSWISTTNSWRLHGIDVYKCL